MAAANNHSSLTNEIIITAMDRFVWFVLLVVMSHLVTEFTRVTGYTRGSRVSDVVLVNDSLMQQQPAEIQNMVLYPGQEYAMYERPSYYYAGAAGGAAAGNPNYNPNLNNVNNNFNYPGTNGHGNKDINNNNINANSPIIAATNTQSGGLFNFSFRPLIDSIFEIPISTLRAVNSLVARLTGSYTQHESQSSVASAAAGVQRTAASEVDHMSNPSNTYYANQISTSSGGSDQPAKVMRKTLLPELSA